MGNDGRMSGISIVVTSFQNQGWAHVIIFGPCVARLSNQRTSRTTSSTHLGGLAPCQCGGCVVSPSWNLAACQDAPCDPMFKRRTTVALATGSEPAGDVFDFCCGPRRWIPASQVLTHRLTGSQPMNSSPIHHCATISMAVLSRWGN